MRHFIAKIEERNGDYEYSHTYTFKAVDLADAISEHEIYTSDFYCSEADEADGGYYFHAGSIFVEAGDVKEISEITYNEIHSF